MCIFQVVYTLIIFYILYVKNIKTFVRELIKKYNKNIFLDK